MASAWPIEGSILSDETARERAMSGHLFVEYSLCAVSLFNALALPLRQDQRKFVKITGRSRTLVLVCRWRGVGIVLFAHNSSTTISGGQQKKVFLLLENPWMASDVRQGAAYSFQRLQHRRCIPKELVPRTKISKEAIIRTCLFWGTGEFGALLGVLLKPLMCVARERKSTSWPWRYGRAKLNRAEHPTTQQHSTYKIAISHDRTWGDGTDASERCISASAIAAFV